MNNKDLFDLTDWLINYDIHECFQQGTKSCLKSEEKTKQNKTPLITVTDIRVKWFSLQHLSGPESNKGLLV